MNISLNNEMKDTGMLCKTKNKTGRKVKFASEEAYWAVCGRKFKLRKMGKHGKY